MEGRTPAELQSDHFIRTLKGFRNTLWLQFSQMSRAWRYHDPYEGDADIRTLARLGTIVEATRVAVSHVLKISGDVLSEQLSQKSDTASDPSPYTSLSQFHRAVRPPYPPCPPPAQKLPHSDSTTDLIYHASPATRGRRPNDDASKMSTGERKTIIHLTSAARTRPKPPTTHIRERKTTTHLTTRTQQEPNSLLMRPIEQNLQRTRPLPYRSTKMYNSPAGDDGCIPGGGHGAAGHLQEEVVVKGARHTPASPNENRTKQANFEKGHLISIKGRYANNHSQSMHFPRPERPSSARALPNDQRTKNTGLDATPLITPTSLARSQEEMKTLCRPPIARPLTQKTENDRGRQTKKRTKISTSHNSATQLDRPNAYWRCPFCTAEYNALMDLRAHNAKHHGGRLFGLECGQCGFQTDSPKLLREHQSRMHEKDADIVDETAADVPADTAIPANTHTTNALDESTPTTTVDKDDRISAAGAGGTRDRETNRPDPPETDCDNTLRGDGRLDEDGVVQSLFSNSGERMALFTPRPPHDAPGLPVDNDEPTNKTVWQQPKSPYDSRDVQDRAGDGRPELDTPVRKSMELISNITDLDNVFAEPPAATQWDIELRNVGEVEVAPIKLEDDSLHVVCPTCYEYLPQACYALHRRGRDCHHPLRPPEVTKERSLEPHHEWETQGGTHLTRSELINEENEWPRANRPPVIRKAKQHEIQCRSTNRGKMTAIYKKALRKPNFDGTYNVNGKITSLQEIKRQIWDLPRCF